MKHLLCTILFCGLSFGGIRSYAQTSQVVLGDTLVSDFEYLVEMLESTHPDPYTGFGGKFFFRKAAFELENRLRSTPHSMQDFYDQVSAFLSNIRDGHTWLSSPAPSGEQMQRMLPLRLKVIPEGLIVNGLPKTYRHLLGSRVLSIQGDSLQAVLTRASQLRACENLYDSYTLICNQILHEKFLHQLFPGQKDSLCLTLLSPDNRTEQVTLPLESPEKAYADITAFVSTSMQLPKKQLEYRFIDKEKQVMYINIDMIYGRDNFEFMYNNGWGGMEQLDSYYRNLGMKKPADTLEAIKNLASFSETFAEMLTEMKDNRSTTLIIDLRGNSGGWTPITLPTLYQLYGPRCITVENGKFYQLISPLLLQKQNTDLAHFNSARKANWKMGDYTLGVEDTTASVPTIEQLCRDNIYMTSVPHLLTAQNGKPLYTPRHVFVVTDCNTFSAAFHYAFYLWKLGATVVGVPSRQAPNTFMEQTTFKLPLTGLRGSISNSLQIFLPGNDRRAKTFYPDWMPSYEDYKKYDFDRNAEILFLLEKLKKEF